jgi:hypothetical protein
MREESKVSLDPLPLPTDELNFSNFSFFGEGEDEKEVKR